MEEKIAKVETVLIENRIFTIRDKQVMIDRDLAELYDVSTKRINEQVKRNIQRFPVSFCFQLSDSERNELVANCDRFKNLKHSSSLPYVFTEQGVAMLSAVFSHDRFLIIDGNELYHIGASLKDAGKKWFAFSKMNSEILPLLTKIQENS